MAKTTQRLLVACSGTGGHFYPGFALAREMKKRGWEPLFLVRTGDPAKSVLDKAGLPWAEIPLSGLPRGKNPLKLFSFGLQVLKALKHTSWLFTDFKPDAVIGFGGYVSFPALYCAKKFKVPSIIHESNAVMGLANRWSAKYATIVALGLTDPAKNTPKGTVTPGTPVRSEFAEETDPKTARVELGLKPDLTTVTMFGGSQGAKKLNMAAAESALKLTRIRQDIQFLHITGRRDYAEMKNIYGSETPNIVVMEYCDRMNLALRAADLAVTRAGASTIAELIALRKPAILIPFPYATNAHQDANAEILQRTGCAALVKEDGPFTENLYLEIIRMLDVAGTLDMMSHAYKKTMFPNPFDAANKLAYAIEELVCDR